MLAVNKLDNPADDTERHRFYSLGEGEPYAISAVHGLGVGDLLDVVVSLLPDRNRRTKRSRRRSPSSEGRTLARARSSTVCSGGPRRRLGEGRHDDRPSRPKSHSK